MAPDAHLYQQKHCHVRWSRNWSYLQQLAGIDCSPEYVFKGATVAQTKAFHAVKFWHFISFTVVFPAMSTAADGSTAVENNLTTHVVVRGSASGFLQEATAGKYTFRVDEPVSVGGSGSAPDPYDYLLAALGACTSMTVGIYARRQKIPLENITVSLRHSRIHASDCEACETKVGMLDRIDLDVQLLGAITPEQHAKLMEIAGKCPVHRTLESEIDIRLHAIQPS